MSNPRVSDSADVLFDEYLDILGCPVCESRSHLSLQGSALVCLSCRRSYPVERGVPILLGDRAELEDRESHESGKSIDTPIMQGVSRRGQMETKKEVHRFWVASTEDYFAGRKTGIDISQRQDGYWLSLDLWEKNVALRNCGAGPILDLGAGTGRITRFLRDHGKNVISVDFVAECLSGPNYPAGTKRANMDVTKLAFQDGCFEMVVSCRVLQSLPTKDEKYAALREIARVLKRGGRLALTEGNPLRVKFVPVPYNFYLTLQDWRELLGKVGLRLERIQGIPFLTAVKVLDRLSLGLTTRLRWPGKLAGYLDRAFGRTFLKHLSLQHDLIAVKD